MLFSAGSYNGPAQLMPESWILSTLDMIADVAAIVAVAGTRASKYEISPCTGLQRS